MNSLSGKTSLLATGGANVARLSSIQRIRCTGVSSAIEATSGRSVYAGAARGERPRQLVQPALPYRRPGQPVGLRPAPLGEIAGPEQPVDDRQVDGEVAVDG